VFLLALKDIAQASGGMTQLAQEAHLNRETLYKTLSKRGNPTLMNLRTLLNVVGLEIAIQPNQGTFSSPKGKRRSI